MPRSLLRLSGALMIIGLLLFPLTVSAHESVPAGDYEIEYGWLNEPPIAGRRMRLSSTLFRRTPKSMGPCQ